MAKSNGLWIPAEIWHDEALSLTEKVLLAQVWNYVSSGLEFYQTNETLAADLAVSVSTVKRSLHNLTEKDYITVASFNGRNRRIDVTKQVQIEPADGSNRAGRKVKMNQQAGQNEPTARSNRTPIKKATKTSTKKRIDERKNLLYPFEDFEQIWQEWVDYKLTEHRFKFKTLKSEQTALHYLQKISKNDKDRATEIIGHSIANGYKGLFELRSSAAAAKIPSTGKFADYFESGQV
jgi:hypothetical protein